MKTSTAASTTRSISSADAVSAAANRTRLNIPAFDISMNCNAASSASSGLRSSAPAAPSLRNCAARLLTPWQGPASKKACPSRGNLAVAAITIRTWAIISGRVIISISRRPKPRSNSRGVAGFAGEDQPFGLLLAVLADQRLEQLLLRVEIDVERAFRNARDPRDIVHAGAVEPVAKEHGPRPVHDLAPLGAAIMGLGLLLRLLRFDFLVVRRLRHDRFGLHRRCSRPHSAVDSKKMTERFGSVLK